LPALISSHPNNTATAAKKKPGKNFFWLFFLLGILFVVLASQYTSGAPVTKAMISISPFQIILSIAAAVILLMIVMIYFTRPKRSSSPEFSKRKIQTGSWQSPDALFFISPTTGVTVECNDKAVELFEVSDKSKLIGIDISSLLKNRWRGDERLKIRDDLDKSGTAVIETVFVTAKGKSFTGIMTAQKSGADSEKIILVRIADISSLRKAEGRFDKLSPVSGQAEAQIKLFEQSGVPIAFIGINYKFSRVNDAFCELIGYSEQELYQMTMLDLIPADEKTREKKNLSSLFRGDVPGSKREVRFIRKSRQVI